MRRTYGELWDRYVAESFPRLQQRQDGLTYPGEEWGNESTWANIFKKLFVPAEVETWSCAIEIGGGGGKYTERVLAANDHVAVWGFDVSRNFLDATGERLKSYVDADRLFLNVIDSERPDAMFSLLDGRGLTGKVDAMFSIDAMVHVDLQYLVAYWMNAALLLKPGGRVLMTLADPTSGSGFQKIVRDVRKFYRFQGRMCPKFEYLSDEIVRQVLGRLGFEVETLDQWSYFEGRTPRDLYLIARLARPEAAQGLRELLASRTRPIDSAAEDPETVAEVWDREAGRILAGKGLERRPEAGAVFDHLLQELAPGEWRRVVEIGPGDGRYTAELLKRAPEARVEVFDISQAMLRGVEARLASDAASGRLVLRRIDPGNPAGMSQQLEAAGPRRSVDAVVSIDAMVHVDLQYLMAYWINAALVLKPGGRLVMSVADASSPEGCAKLMADVPALFPYQGQARVRFEYTSPQVVRTLLQNLGFEVERLEHWRADAAAAGPELYVVARLEHPERADTFRTAVDPIMPLTAPEAPEPSEPSPQAAAAPSRQPAAAAEPSTAEQDEVARALGHAYWRHLFMQSHPNLNRAEMREQLRKSWGGSRREFARLGRAVLRQLEGMGYAVRKERASDLDFDV